MSIMDKLSELKGDLEKLRIEKAKLEREKELLIQEKTEIGEKLKALGFNSVDEAKSSLENLDKELSFILQKAKDTLLSLESGPIKKTIEEKPVEVVFNPEAIEINVAEISSIDNDDSEDLLHKKEFKNESILEDL